MELKRYLRLGGIAKYQELLLSEAVASLMKDLECLDPLSKENYFKRVAQDKLLRVLIETLMSQTIPKVQEFGNL